MSPNNNNVFSGKDSLLQYYDPDCNPMLPLVEIPNHPFESDHVRIYAKMLTCLPAANVKLLPALNMLRRAKEQGKINSDTKIVEYSSGSTVTSLAILGRIMGLKGAIAYVSNKTSQAKLDLLRFFGLETKLFGGPGQPSPTDENGGIYRATVDGKFGDNFNPSQYLNPDNYSAHQRWTGPQIIKQLPNISIFASGMGTTGTMTGTGLYLKSVQPKIVNVGVCTAPGDLVHGPRNLSLVGSITFPWRDAIDALEEASAFESFEASLDLCRQGLLCGPSSGLSKTGLYKFLERTKTDGGLDALRAEDGFVYCVFTCCDLPYQYVEEYYKVLGESYFPPIHDHELLNVDSYPYQLEWELSAMDTFRRIFPDATSVSLPGSTTCSDVITPKNVIVLDIRSTVDFVAAHITGALNIDIGNAGAPNPFLDASTMVTQWTTLNTRLSSKDPEFGEVLEGATVIALCYSGATSRVATSVLRHRDVEAFFCVDGIQACLDLAQNAGYVKV